jgi:capsular polysaccharide biosynthesis protein
MASSEQAVRDAAAELHAAILDAEADGYRIAWPTSAAGLPEIAISETGRVAPAAESPPKLPIWDGGEFKSQP